jgi:exonuclease SbcC
VRFDRVHLEGFKCFEEADLGLEPGVSVIHGLNGSGKSSLLEACFFALYGAKALERTLDEVVTIGAEEATVELCFTHAGGDYHVKRRVRVRDERATTVECVLTGPEATYEGARDVRARVTELLRMDHEAFVNCAYVRQGEVNKLINASPGERQDILDDLLQLGKLEEYRERASEARLGVKHVRDDKQGALSQVDSQLEEKDEEGLHARLNELRTERSEVTAEVDRFETNREQATETLADAEGVLEEYRERQAELAEVEGDIEALQERIETTEREREGLAEELAEARERLADARNTRDGLLADTGFEAAEPEQVRERVTALEAEVETLTERITELSAEKRQHDTEAESLEERATELEAEAEQRRNAADGLESEVEEGEALLEEKRAEVAELAAEAETHRDAFGDAPVGPDGAAELRESVAAELSAVREERAATEETLTNAEERLAEAEQLRAAGKCPECGQPVEDSPHVEALDERRERVAELEAELETLGDRESDCAERLDRAERLEERASELRRLETERENAKQLIEQRRDRLQEKAAEADRKRESADELETEAAERREAAAEARQEATACREKVAECNREKAELTERGERLERLAETAETAADLADRIEDYRDQRAQKAELNEERRERLAEKRERREELREEFNETRVEEAREEKERAEDYLERVDPKLETLRERRDELNEAVGGVEAELDELHSLRDRREELAATVERLDSVYGEAEQLEEMYARLRAQLRRRNVETLERMLNETFDLVYENDTYSRIELDADYELTVYQKDGETLAPDQLSGGERALFNLSLRCAIYRLLAEGIEGAAPMPPLVLDEPTVFLDSGHVSQLVELVGAMRDHGVEQILVVSHDEELVAAADDLVRVRTDPRSNRSTVERTASVDADLLAEADD